MLYIFIHLCVGIVILIASISLCCMFTLAKWRFNFGNTLKLCCPLHYIKKHKNTFVLSDKTKYFVVGDKIRISVTLRELNGNLRTRGGDKLHVRIMNTELDALAPGYVTDHDNGSYTAVVYQQCGRDNLSYLFIYNTLGNLFALSFTRNVRYI